VLQLLSSGLNLMGANQHLATALWGVLMIVVMAARTIVSTYIASRRKKG
jgi:simple sugar transport system permease protein